MIASKLKQNAPNCHTYLEIMRVRWGKMAHLTFLFFGLGTNIIVSSTYLAIAGSGHSTRQRRRRKESRGSDGDMGLSWPDSRPPGGNLCWEDRTRRAYNRKN
jgi:hypothetical protein